MANGDLLWFPVLKKDIRLVENVQRRAIRLRPDLVFYRTKNPFEENKFTYSIV